MSSNGYVIVNGELYHSDELYHYGVVGMKWGVRKATRLQRRNDRLAKKALSYDKKAANLTKKSEKHHAKYDLEGTNKKAIKAAKYDAKAAALGKRALKTDSESKRTSLEQRAEKMKYKAAKNRMDGDRISKTTGYGHKAMKYSIKSDAVAKKAAKARMKMANNQAYIDKMKQKVSTLSEEELRNGYAFCNTLR